MPRIRERKEPSGLIYMGAFKSLKAHPLRGRAVLNLAFWPFFNALALYQSNTESVFSALLLNADNDLGCFW